MVRRYRARIQRKRKPNYARRAALRRSRPLRLRQKIHSFTRTAFFPALYTVALGAPAVGQGISFKLSDVPSSNDFTALFDQYKIKAVKWTLIPRSAPGQSESVITAGALQQQNYNIWSVIDNDDANPPAALVDLLQYENVKCTKMTQKHTRYLKPSVATEIYSSGITSTYGPKMNQWLDCAGINTEHYGIKLWIEGGDPQTPRMNFDVMIKYYMQFKNVR